jgi:ATP-dependent Clp protease ATP-binding subunit ClpA
VPLEQAYGYPALADDLDAIISESVPDDEPYDLIPSVAFQQVMSMAAFNAQTSERGEVGGPHVLIAYFNLRDCHAVYLMQQQGLTKLDLMDYASHQMNEPDDADVGDDEGETSGAAPGDFAAWSRPCRLVLDV